MTARSRRITLALVVAFHAVAIASITILFRIADSVPGVTGQALGLLVLIVILTELNFVPLWARLWSGSWSWRVAALTGVVAACWLLSVAAKSAELDLVVMGMVITALGTAHWAARSGVSIKVVDFQVAGGGGYAPIQFSISGLLMLTCLVAVAVQAFRTTQPSEVFVSLSLIGSSAAVCWLATWAGLGNARWPWRLLSIAGLVAIVALWHLSATWWLGWCFAADFSIALGTFLILRVCGYRLTISSRPTATTNIG